MTAPTRPGTAPEPAGDPRRERGRGARWRRPTARPRSSRRSTRAGSRRTCSRPTGRGPARSPHQEPFVVIMPPPNVTGALHLGHAARTATEDLMVRRARMQQRPTLWLPGVDHASIAAQWVLRRDPRGRRHDPRGARPRALPRADAALHGRDAADHHGPAAAPRRVRGLGPRALHDGRALGARGAGRVHATLRGRPRLPRREARELVSGLRHERVGPRGHRDARGGHALAHPLPPPRRGWRDGRRRASRPSTARSSSRRPARRRSSATPRSRSTPTTSATRRIVGRTVRIPFVERDVPVIADTMVERDFGTGAVKITPAHDHADFETAERHGLPRIDVMNDDGTLNANAGPYAGLSREEARRRVLDDLTARGDLVEARPHEMVIGRCQRSDDVVEPRLKVQWFVDVKPMAERAMAGRPRGADPLRAAALREGVLRLDGEHPRLEREPPALVGPSHPGLVLPRRPRDGHRRRGGPAALRDVRHARTSRRRPTRSTPGSRAGCGRSRRSAGPRTTRRPADVLPDDRDGDRLRHPLLLGRADDDARGVADRPGAVLGRLPVGARARPLRPEDVEDEGQRHRPARGHRRDRGRRAALRARQRRGAGRRPAARAVAPRRRAQLREQDLERGALRARRATRRAAGRRRARAAGGRAHGPGRALDPRALRGRGAGGRQGVRDRSSSPRRRASSTRRSGPSTATGTSRWRRRGWRRASRSSGASRPGRC